MSIIPQTSKRYTGFTPTSIPNCSLWLDAADTSSLFQNTTLTTSITADGQTIQGIKNKVSTSSATGSSGPTFKTNIRNGLNVMRYNGSQSLTTSSYTFTTTNVSIFTVGLLTSTANGYYKSIIYGSPDQIVYLGSGNGTFLTFSQGNWGSSNSPNVSILNSWSLMSAVFSGTVLTPYLNGTSQNTKTATTPRSAVTNLSIGGNTNWIGDIGEILIYDSALTTSERQQVEGYLAWKWGLTGNLPNTHPFKYTPLYTRIFQPVDIPGCVMWLDAADASSLTLSGSSVTQWNDKSGNGNNGTPYNSPTYANNGITFNGTNQYFSCPNTSYRPPNIFIIANYTGTGEGTLLRKGYSSGVTYEFSMSILTTTTLRYELRTSGGGSININNTVASTLGTQMYEVTYDNTTGTGYFNGISQGTGTAAGPIFSGSTSLLIGTFPSDSGVPSGAYFKGNMYEIIIFNSVLSTSQRQQVEGYLANKWGLRSNLPSTHPFKLYPVLNVSFTPLSVTGCSLWLDASDTSSNSMVLNGSIVTTWKDKSGNGYSGTSSGSPTIVSNGQNGLSVVNFVNTSSQYFNFGDINDLGTNSFHIFVVSKYNDTSNGALVVKTVAGNSVGRYALFRESGSIIPLIESPGGNSTGGASDTSTSTRILTMFWNRSTLGLIQNGTTIVTGTQVNSTNLNTTFPFLVGAYNNGSGGVPPASGLYFNGYMMEVIMYLGSLTTQQRQQVEGYLAWKWGIQNSLASTHPFKKITP